MQLRKFSLKLLFAISLFYILMVEATAQLPVIIKLDDLKYSDDAKMSKYGVSHSWVSIMLYLKQKDIKASLGVVAMGLENSTPRHRKWVKELIRDGHEIWHHGYSHAKNGKAGEYHGHSFFDQKESFGKALTLIESTYDTIVVSVGTPFNQNDNTFLKVLESYPQIKVCIFIKGQCPNRGMNLKRFGSKLEYKVGEIDAALFSKYLEKNLHRPYLVLQGHPSHWNNKDKNEFKKILDMLIKNNARFITAEEYYLRRK
ncbi:DUF2334 domain-containing protein [Agaribacter flavus]|uniref:DUF2334 domain-containing protein n=1 Tax=Agaribacter flavus TaxID=1902781 RepID=A0ABV7FKT7_9ALTE